jgi:excisionase family DNA binding protein
MDMDESNATGREENHSIMTVHELAYYLRLSEAKVYRLANNGCIPSFRLGTSWRFRKDLIDDWTKKAILKVP